MEIKEFEQKAQTDQKAGGARSKKKARRKQSSFAGGSLRELTENKGLIMLCVFVLLAVLTIVLGMVVFHIPPVTVCLVVLIEALLAVCLHYVPVWLHGIVLVAEVVLGVIASQTVFMILACLCYLAAIFTLKFETEKESVWKRA